MVLRFFLFSAIVFLACPLFAEKSPPAAHDPLDAIFSEEIEKELAEEFKWLHAETETVWSASKYTQKISEAPSLVSIITAEDIKRFGYNSLADIVRSVSGVYTTYNRDYDYIGLRGFNRPGDLNTRVLLLVDGHRINDKIFQQAAIGTDFPVDVDMIDKVEITRGPGSCLYGTDAFFGVINVITKKGWDLQGFEVASEADTFDTYKGRVSFGDKLSKTFEVLISGSLYGSQGDEHLYYKEFDDPSTNYGIAEHKDADHFYNMLVKLRVGELRLSGVYSSRNKSVPTASFGTVFNETFTTIDNRGYVELTYAHQFNENMQLNTTLYYDHYTYQGQYRYAAEREDGSNYIRPNRDVDLSEWIGSEARLTRKFFGHSSVTLGAEYQYNTHQDMRSYDEEPYSVRLDEQNTSSTWAIYLQDETRITSNLLFNGGIRYDWYDSFGGTFNPRLALIYQPVAATNLKLIYGTAFRAPNVYESYVAKWAALELDPEKIRTYEIIWAQSYGGYLKSFISGFYYTIAGLISQVPHEDNWAFDNVENIEAKGIEMELQGTWENGWQSVINYTYQEVQNTSTHETLSNSPTHLLKGRLTVPLFSDRLFGSIEGQYLSARKTIRNTTTEDYFVANMTLFWKNVINNLDLSVSAYNLFDKHYADPVGEENIQEVIAQNGRAFRLKATYTF